MGRPAEFEQPIPHNLHNSNPNKDYIHKTSFFGIQLQFQNKIPSSHSYYIATSKSHIMEIWSYYWSQSTYSEPNN